MTNPVYEIKYLLPKWSNVPEVCLSQPSIDSFTLKALEIYCLFDEVQFVRVSLPVLVLFSLLFRLIIWVWLNFSSILTRFSPVYLSWFFCFLVSSVVFQVNVKRGTSVKVCFKMYFKIKIFEKHTTWSKNLVLRLQNIYMWKNLSLIITVAKLASDL